MLLSHRLAVVSVCVPLLSAWLDPWTARADEQAPARALAPEVGPDSASLDPHSGRLIVTWAKVGQALQRRDMGEAQRLASMVRSESWRTALTPGAGPSADTATALSLLPSLRGGEGWLPYLGAWMLRDGPDDIELVNQAMLVAATLLEQRDPGALHAWEVPASTVANLCSAFLWVAGDQARPLALRLSAIEALAGAGPMCPTPPAKLLSDPLPEIRRAAVATVPSGETGLRLLQPRVADEVPVVASAAAARLCLEDDKPTPALLRVARRFALDSAAAEDTFDMLNCLARSENKEDRMLLEGVSRNGLAPLRRRARDLLAMRRSK